MSRNHYGPIPVHGSNRFDELEFPNSLGVTDVVCVESVRSVPLTVLCQSDREV